MKSPLELDFEVTCRYEQLDRTSRALFQWIEKCTCSGDLQVQENREELGPKEECSLMLSALVLSSGMVTRLKRILSSMNFVEASMSHTYYGGSIVTQSVWRSRDLPDPFMVVGYGLPATSTPVFGSPTSTMSPTML